MKKLIICILICNSASAQKATISNDTAYYMSRTYFVGDTIRLAYGSAGDKDFAFVMFGGDMQGYKPLRADHSKNALVIDKVYMRKGKATVRGKDIDYNAGINKIFIDLEGAVDNKELQN